MRLPRLGTREVEIGDLKIEDDTWHGEELPDQGARRSPGLSDAPAGTGHVIGKQPWRAILGSRCSLRNF